MRDFVGRELVGLLGWAVAAAVVASAVVVAAGLPAEWAATTMTVAAVSAVLGRPRAKVPAVGPWRGRRRGGRRCM